MTYIKVRLALKSEDDEATKGKPVLNWISDTIFQLIGWIPNWLYADDTPRYYVVRGFLGMLLLVAIILAVVLWNNLRRHQQGGEF